ncbi:hypothetical protein ACVFI8_19060 [Agarivorans sp. MS3-6]
MNKAMIVTLLTLSANAAFANDKIEEEINYGDPTASFSTVGLSASENTTQLNGMAGFGKNIFSLDLARDNKSGDLNYRGRYFHVTDGLGYSVDVLGDKDSTTALAGAIYKMQLNDNISIFPMASLGYTSGNKSNVPDIELASNDKQQQEGSTLGQLGIYAMYAFDNGNWLYANPKSTYHVRHNEFINQIEMGGGIMVTDYASVGAKVEYTAENKNLRLQADTVVWLQGNVYF